MEACARCSLSVLVTAALFGGPVPAAAQADSALALAVRNDHCTFVLDTEQSGQQFYLVIGSLAREVGPFRILIQTRPTSDPLFLPVEEETVDRSWRFKVQERNARLERARQQQPALEEEAPLAAPRPPPQKIFHVLARTGRLDDAANYTAVVAELRALGRHCQAYVDRSHPDPAAVQPTLEDAIRTFDDEVYPKTAREFGRALDVDRDGRFTLLFTPCLGKLQAGKMKLDGLVRGSDFYRDLDPPFSNRCDLMYLSTALRPGPYLRTIVAHEYTHAVSFCEHVLTRYLPGVPPREEESWLDEGLAHLAEEFHGHGWSNLDYRISAFLNRPERYPLVVADYYGKGVWREPGMRGAAYLFLRWCRETHAPGLAARLIQSNLAGIDNLEAATEEPFAALFRRWTLALAQGPGWSLPSPARAAAPPFGRLLCGPRLREVALAGQEQDFSLAGTAAAYLRLSDPSAPRTRVTIVADAGTALQVSLIPLPRPSPRLLLKVEKQADKTSVRLVLTAQGGPVELQDAAWEELDGIGPGNEGTSYRAGAAPLDTIHAWFGNPRLADGETRASTAIELPRNAGRLIWKVKARDMGGHSNDGFATFTSE
jgi:hypothetical protein